jgi:glycine/sarcosine N-methyltransferase
MKYTDFYNSLSEDYDSMTNFEQRYLKEESFFNFFASAIKNSNALDVGCGTGFHSILLSNLGVDVIGIDSSPKMIEKAKKNAAKLKKKIEFINSGMNSRIFLGRAKFEFIFCMGNMLPHLLKRRDIEKIFSHFYKVLKPGGEIITQTLNYEKLLKQKERIVNITESKNKIFVRFYDFQKNLIRFNILIMKKENQKWGHSLITTELFPYKSSDLISIAKNLGLSVIDKVGDMNFSEYDKNNSENVILIFQKPMPHFDLLAKYKNIVKNNSRK